MCQVPVSGRCTSICRRWYIAFLNDYNNGALSLKSTNIVKLELLNDNFTVTEINKIIESLKE